MKVTLLATTDGAEFLNLGYCNRRLEGQKVFQRPVREGGFHLARKLYA